MNRTMNTVIVGLGSNLDKEKNIEIAGRLLSGYFISIRFSETVYTEPVEIDTPSLFLNQVAIALTPDSPDKIIAVFKQMEIFMGRKQGDKAKGNIPIDIDLLQWNDQILKPQDLQRPYVQSALAGMLGTDQEDKRCEQ